VCVCVCESEGEGERERGELKVQSSVSRLINLRLPKICVRANDKHVLLVLLFLSTAISTPIDYMTGIIVSSSLDMGHGAHTWGSQNQETHASTQTRIASCECHDSDANASAASEVGFAA